MKTNFTKIGFNHSVWAIIVVCLLFVSGNVWGTDYQIAGDWQTSGIDTIKATITGSDKLLFIPIHQGSSLASAQKKSGGSSFIGLYINAAYSSSSGDYLQVTVPSGYAIKSIDSIYVNHSGTYSDKAAGYIAAGASGSAWTTSVPSDVPLAGTFSLPSISTAYTQARAAVGTTFSGDSIQYLRIYKSIKTSKVGGVSNSTTFGSGQTHYIQRIVVTVTKISASAECPSYSFHWGIKDEDGWEQDCFEYSGSDDVHWVNSFTIPAAEDATHFYVGKFGSFYETGGLGNNNAKSYTNPWMYMPFTTSQGNGSGTRPMVGQAEGATGKIRIADNSTWDNLFVSFLPDGYKLKFGSTEKAFAVEAGNEYRSELVEYNSSTADDAVSVGIIDSEGGYVSTDNTQEMRHLFLNTGGTSLWSADGRVNFGIYSVTSSSWVCLMAKVPGEDYLYEGWVPTTCEIVIFARLNASTLSWDNRDNQTENITLASDKNLYTITGWANNAYSVSAYEKKGKFRMNADYTDKNWYVRFYPYYVVSFVAGDGSGSMDAQSVAVDAATKNITLEACSLTPPMGYAFSHWTADVDVTISSETVEAGEEIDDEATLQSVGSDITLTAHWSPVTYTITLAKGAQGAADQSATVAYDATELTSITHVTATGYDRTGYYSGSTKVLNADGSFAKNDVTGFITGGKWSKADDCTLTAKWTAQKYDIIYKDKGNVDLSGAHNPVYAQKHTYGSVTTLAKASKSGYVFEGWYTESDCSSGKVTTLGATAYTASPTLYANWVAMDLDALESGVLYKAEDMVTAGQVIETTQRYRAGVSESEMFNILGSGTSDASGGPMGAIDATSGEADATIDGTDFATTLNFKGNAASAGTSGSTLPTSRAIQFVISDAGQLDIYCNYPSKIYLIKSGSNTEQIDADGTSTAKITKAVTAGTYYLYARSSDAKLYGLRYTRTYSVSAATSTGDNTKGTVSAAKTVLAEDSTTVVTAVPATGYQVTNWAVSGTGASISPSGSSNSNTTTLTMGTTDATVTVTFGAIDYTITHSDPTGDGTYTISVAGGSAVSTNTTANYGQTITLAATPDDGYVLDSWTVTGATSGDAITVTSNQFTMPAEGVTVAATFTVACTDVDAPTSLTCSAQTPNTLTYTWTKASNASGYTATLYPDEDCEETPVSTQVLSDEATVTFTSLTASTTYYCKVQSNGDGSTYCANGGTTSAQSGTTTAPRIIYNANLDGTSGSTTDGTSTEGAKACGYSKSGYKFKWWNTAADGSGEDFYVGESVTLGGSDVNLYAQWEEVGSGWAYWVGDVAISSVSTAYDVTGNGITMQITRSTNSDWNDNINAEWNQVSKYNGTTVKKAKVLAVDSDNDYIEINFKDGSTINDLYLGITSDQTDAQNFVVCYSTTADFSSGAYEFVKVGLTDNVVSVPGHDQATKSTTRVKPSTADTYKYVRIYRKLTAGTGYNDTEAALGCSNKARIYSIKAQKGTASYTVTYAAGDADDGDVPVDANEYAEGEEVTVLGQGDLEKTEHTFGGWSDGVNTYDEDDTFTMPASDVTLTAVWIINQYNVAVASVDHVTITATPAGGSAISEGNNANVDYGKSVTLAYSSLESGNYWGGWKVTKNSDGSDVTASVVDGNTLTVPAYAVTVSAVTYGDLVVWCDPDITITGDIHLTSVKDVYVYATSGAGNLLNISSEDLAGVISLSIAYLDADNGDAEVAKASSRFRLCNDGSSNYNVADGSNINVSASNECDLSYSIKYTPINYDTINHYKLQITMNRSGRPNKVVTYDLYGRSLPEEFVVASKSNDGQWYALPNTLAGTSEAQSAITPTKITVDNTTTPTQASYAPTTVIYKGTGRNAPASNINGVRFTTDEAHWLQTGSGSKMWLSGTNSDASQVWYLKSTDFGAYELKMDPSQSPTTKLGIYGGNMGMYASPTSPSEKIYLLPVETKYTDIPASVTEWGQNSVVLAANPGATATKAQARVDGGSPTEDQTISAINAAMGTAKNVKVPVGDIDLADLANNEGKLLYIDWYNSSSTLLGTSCVTIPRIIAADRNMYKDGETTKTPWNTEVHVLPGATLTANTASYSPSGATIKELHIYPGATLNVSTGTLTATTLRLHNGWTRAGATKQYNTARVYINATNHAALAKGTASMDYDIYELTDGKHYYPLAVPFETSVSSIDYADSYLAGFSTYGANGQYLIKEYNGARRAEQGPDQKNNWTPVASDATLSPGKGYIMSAVAVKGEAIIRVPLVYNDAWTADGEKGTASYGEPAAEHTKNVVAVEAYTGTAATANKSNAGWNLLGVPFMSCYATNMENMIGEEETTFINGRLILTGDPSSPLAFDDTDEHIYVNVPTHDFSEYLQTEIDEATLLPGWCFMVQIGTSGNLTFLTSAQAESSSTPIHAPRRTAEEERVLRTGIVLSDAEKSDKTTILVSQRYNEEYEIGADLEKMFGDGYTLATYSVSNNTRLAYNAMSPTNAENVIPIGYRAPADGEYTFSINPRYLDGAFDRVDLIDYQEGTLTNLLNSSYTFLSPQTQNDNRFALNLVPRQETPTTVDHVESGNDEQMNTYKVIINNKLYIILGQQMYDATGKCVKGGQQ